MVLSSAERLLDAGEAGSTSGKGSFMCLTVRKAEKAGREGGLWDLGNDGPSVLEPFCARSSDHRPCRVLSGNLCSARREWCCLELEFPLSGDGGGVCNLSWRIGVLRGILSGSISWEGYAETWSMGGVMNITSEAFE